MAKSFIGRKRVRKSFGRIPTVVPIPNLIEVQKSSYDNFLQVGVPAKKRTSTGLQEVFQSVFPIKDFAEKSELEFIKYELDEPKYDVDECIQRGLTYAAPLKVTLRLVVWSIDEDTGAKSIKDIKEQEVYMGDMPLMTDTGTFVVNGTQRVVVSQMHRSPGVFFDHDEGKTHPSGKYLFAARIIPYRGSWLDFEFDAKDLVYVRIDRRRKLPITSLLYALDNESTAKLRAERAAAGQKVSPEEVQGMSQEDILDYYYERVLYKKDKDGWKTAFIPAQWKGVKLAFDLVNADNGEVVMPAGEKVSLFKANAWVKDGLKEIRIPEPEILGKFAAADMINEQTGEIILEAAEEITQEEMDMLEAWKVKELELLNIDYVNIGPYIRNTMAADKNSCREEALIDIYKVMRPGEPPTLDTAEALFRSLFFDTERYDLSAVGRVKMNARLGYTDVPDDVRVLRREDILDIVKVLVNLKDGRGEIDDIDHLGNRRVRSVGELMENQFRIGLLRMDRAIKERMSSVDIDSIMPHDLINAKPVAAAVR